MDRIGRGRLHDRECTHCGVEFSVRYMGNPRDAPDGYAADYCPNCGGGVDA